ncbi:enoyl-CoA delta isomerase 1, mitochondrial-like [Haematobia irritans]|uniref:enoyl-CoA delta isomerase 1, mitochondrial-like n=1 Tax=Haematobia irritans TaxID=7368 RepID=UPI003F508A59
MHGLRIFSKKVITRPLQQHLRCMSSSSIIDVNVDNKGIAVLHLNTPPVNAMTMDMLTMVKPLIKNLEQNKCRGMIFTSALKTVFCAGLDIKELYRPNIERFRLYYRALQDAWLALYATAIPTVALINGHAPAGGCMLSTCCDYRVMLPNYTIGLNEVQLAVHVPVFVRASFCNVLPKRNAEMALTQGKLFTSHEALHIGLIDKLVNSKEEGLEKCYEFLSTFDKVHPIARSLTKQQFRAADVEQFYRERYQDLESFIEHITEERAQKIIGEYLEKLHNKKRN